MDVELKGCPWCGKVPNIGPWGAQDVNAWPDATAIECSSDLHDCPINPSVTGYTRAEAITDWNNRHGAGDAEAWRPIESAPRDGTYILVCNSHGSWIAKWKPVFQSGFRPSNPWASMMLNHDHIEKPGRFDHPTHWRPLPGPPTDDAARAGERGVS